MSKIVLTLGAGHTLRDAARRMTEKGVGAAIVLDEDSPGPRIISERDILNSLGRGEDPDSECVVDHMSDTLIAAAPDWSLERAAMEMASRHIRHLVVVERASRGPALVWPEGLAGERSKRYGETMLWYGHGASRDPRTD